jgi:tRNA threonylcarbamoyladenosine biosynthesis protein TsaB
LTRVLALDTSTWWGGLALVERDADEPPRVVAELGVEVRDSHAMRLLPAIHLLLERAGWDRSSPDLYVATRGPGSFTGIRVGLGTVHGLALATGKPCAGVGTLEALAEAHGPAERERVPLLAAGRGEVYGARYDACSSPPRPLRDAWLGRAEEVLAAEGPAVLIEGPGAAAPIGALGRDDDRFRLAAPVRSVAAAAGRLTLLRGARGDSTPPMPLYLRPPDAELKRRKR